MFRITYVEKGKKETMNVYSKMGAIYYYTSLIYIQNDICELKIIKLDDKSFIEEDITGKVNKFIQKL